MQVLGKTRNGYIVEISGADIAQLAGFASLYSSGWSNDSLDMGAETDIGQIFNEAQDAIDTHKDALQAAKNLKGASTKFLNFFQVEDQKKKGKQGN